MSEMQKMGMDPKKHRPRQERVTQGASGGGVGTGTVRREPRVELSTSDETFNLIARSLLNISDEVPRLVRDCADIRVDNGEIKQMIFQLSNNIANLTTDIKYIVQAIAEMSAVPTPLTQRMKLAADPDEPMPSILTRLQDVAGNSKK